ncbi:MAG: alpha/beta fold hydrolase [Henriciella sp.]
MSDPFLYSEATGLRDAPAILLLNSLGATHRMWDPQLKLLESHFYVIRCDTRGHGQSSSPPGPYNFDDLVVDALQILNRHEVQRATIVGLSMGAMTALGIGLRAPERVEKIVFSAGRADAPDAFIKNWDDRIAMVQELGLDAVWARTEPTWFTDDFRNTNPDMISKIKQQFLMTDPAGYVGCCRALQQLDYLRLLNELEVTTHCIAGSKDVAAPSKVVQSIARACRNGTFSEIGGSAHLINVNQPAAFNQVVSEFLDL